MMSAPLQVGLVAGGPRLYRWLLLSPSTARQIRTVSAKLRASHCATARTAFRSSVVIGRFSSRPSPAWDDTHPLRSDKPSDRCSCCIPSPKS
jgi:hypothetical protein